MILLVIPARLQSTRLPEKPLADFAGKPMIWWTWQKAKLSKLVDKVIIATDSEKIKEVMQGHGAEVMMTSESCQSGTDRVHEVAQAYAEATTVINLQGDEPLMPVEILDGTIQAHLDNANAEITTPSVPFGTMPSVDPTENSNVKVVFNSDMRAIYFSRAELAASALHLGLYVYRPESLAKFCTLSPSKLEKAERLEQLRALEAGMEIYMYQYAENNRVHFGIDTPEDLERALQYLPELKADLGLE